VIFWERRHLDRDGSLESAHGENRGRQGEFWVLLRRNEAHELGKIVEVGEHCIDLVNRRVNLDRYE
jgi:hypothetical protein